MFLLPSCCVVEGWINAEEEKTSNDVARRETARRLRQRKAEALEQLQAEGAVLADENRRLLDDLKGSMAVVSTLLGVKGQPYTLWSTC